MQFRVLGYRTSYHQVPLGSAAYYMIGVERG